MKKTAWKARREALHVNLRPAKLIFYNSTLVQVTAVLQTQFPTNLSRNTVDNGLNIWAYSKNSRWETWMELCAPGLKSGPTLATASFEEPTRGCKPSLDVPQYDVINLPLSHAQHLYKLKSQGPH